MTRLRLIALLVIVVVLGLLALLIPRNREPHYEGRPLSAWLNDARIAATGMQLYGREDNPKWQAANKAVREIGTNALPWLLKWGSAQDSKPKAAIIAWLNSHPLLHCKMLTDHEKEVNATCGFVFLSAKAKPAWPVLSQWTSEPTQHRRLVGLNLLDASNAGGQTLLPILQRLINDPDKDIQGTAAIVFSQRFPNEAKAAGVYKRFPGLQRAFPL